MHKRRRHRTLWPPAYTTQCPPLTAVTTLGRVPVHKHWPHGNRQTLTAPPSGHINKDDKSTNTPWTCETSTASSICRGVEAHASS